MPTMSKTPTSASRLAAVVSGRPWSCAAGMKCVPTRPFVVAPQIAKPPTRNQNVPVVDAVRSATASAGPGRARPVARTGRVDGLVDGAAVGLQRRRRPGSRAASTPRAAPRSARRPSTVSAATFQPCAAMISASTRQEDQLAGRAAGGQDAGDQAAAGDEPAAGDRSRRRRAPSNRCRGRPARPSTGSAATAAVMKTVSPLPAATSTSAAPTTRRRPNRSISAAANGAVRP